MSFDPLATDRVALEVIKSLSDDYKDEDNFVTQKSLRFLDEGHKAGLGAGELSKIELVSI
jgi:hypothetical protein